MQRKPNSKLNVADLQEFLGKGEKARDQMAMREKLNPRNASQRQVVQTKQVLATNVVSLGDCFGDRGSFPFA